MYTAGCAGQRFGVRNSGAVAVVEDAGDHCCEYMTGGVVAVLGGAGMNFGAGMTGGFAFVLDAYNTFFDRCNRELVDIHRLQPERMEAHRDYLEELLEDYVKETGSAWGREILEEFDDRLHTFWLVKPKAAEIAGLLDTLHKAA